MIDLSGPVTESDVALAERWRQFAVDIEQDANRRGVNDWAKRILVIASRALSEAALVQDRGDGIKRRLLDKYRD
jgi:hypothetical protein